jgi:pre-mRNA-processing factor 6
MIYDPRSAISVHVSNILDTTIYDCTHNFQIMAFRGTQKGPPKGYIPGLGRGAAGFTTRSDVGPAGSDVTPSATSSGSRAAEARAAKLAAQRQNQSGAVSEGGRFGVAPQGYIPGMGRGASSMGVGQANVGSNDGGPSSAIEENQAQSYISNYEDDDEEADRIYDEIDKRMKTKRKKMLMGILMIMKKMREGWEVHEKKSATSFVN